MENRVILFADDDREILRIYKAFMEKKGYSVFTCEDGAGALDFLAENKADCIVLDVMMPGQDGFELLPKIRERSDAPVLFLSGKTGTSDRIRGLSLGADDYITKPCSLEELSLRIELNIRKNDAAERQNLLEYPPLWIDLTDRKVRYGEEEIVLSNREYELLVLFARNPEIILTFEQIGTAMNGAYLSVDRQNVMTAVSRLRKKMKMYAKTPDLIETVWGEGYRFRG